MSQETGVSRITLKVSEASSRDVGKGLVRLDPKDMQQAGVSVGDIVLICGKRATAAKVMPAGLETASHAVTLAWGLARRRRSNSPRRVRQPASLCPPSMAG